MKTLIHTDGVTLTRRLEGAIEDKLGHVLQYATRAMGVRVQLRKTSAHAGERQFLVRVLVEIPGHDINAEQVGPDPMSALDVVVEKLESRLRKRKTARLDRRNKRTPSIGDAF